MTKKNRLSHSSVSTYLTCGQKYKLHYIDRLRSTQMHSALVFGSAIDKALDAMLQDHKAFRLDPFLQVYNTIFINNWRKGELNKQPIDMIDNPDVVYAAADMDFKLFKDKDYQGFMSVLQGSYENAGTLKEGTNEALIEVYKNIGRRKETNGWENLHVDERKFYNYMNWACLCIKGELMIKAYMEEIIPSIKRVISTQEAIVIEGEDGDSVTGFVDAIVEWKDGRIVILDNKTSAREYEYDAVTKSQQLALYTHALEHKYNTRTAGFIVMRKLIDKDPIKKCSVCGMDGVGNRGKTCTNEESGKRCSGAWTETFRPKAKIQVLINDIQQRHEQLTMENFAEVNHAVKAEVFPRNFDKCTMGSWKCPYFDLCHRGSSKGLTKLPEDK